MRHSAQGSIKGMLVSSAVWGPKVPKCHGLLKGFRKSASRECHRRRFLLAGAVEPRRRCPPRGVQAEQQARDTAVSVGGSSLGRCWSRMGWRPLPVVVNVLLPQSGWHSAYPECACGYRRPLKKRCFPHRFKRECLSLPLNGEQRQKQSSGARLPLLQRDGRCWRAATDSVLLNPSPPAAAGGQRLLLMRC